MVLLFLTWMCSAICFPHNIETGTAEGYPNNFPCELNYLLWITSGAATRQYSIILVLQKAATGSHCCVPKAPGGTTPAPIFPGVLDGQQVTLFVRVTLFVSFKPEQEFSAHDLCLRRLACFPALSERG
ncbi:hypothetical protein AV530_002857 [Patagioenas fasciata monilis]|uniref:Secreted protein n=1 Tax=Patagioenas fasciata monilis TaxID=372326 RepID=A0A1V4K9G5_PATFA|nr:hypothetical protein AV530_002857 [Patagioenas fasciata monilis]